MKRRVLLGASAATAVLTLGVLGGAAGASNGAGDGNGNLRNQLGFTPLDSAPQTCDTTTIRWPVGVDATPVMQAGDNAGGTPVKTDGDMIALDPSGRYVFTVTESSSGSSQLVKLDSSTGQKSILATDPTWTRLDPIKWHVPSGQLVIGEENGTGGRVFQVDPTTGAKSELTWLGHMSHEGIAFDSQGNVWEGDESHTGAIYKGVPANPADLTAGGTLYAMVDGIGFTAAIDPANAVSDAAAKGATKWDRPEDFDYRDRQVYFTVTEGQADATASGSHVGGVYRVNDTGTPKVTTFVPLGSDTVGLQFPDNIAFDPLGNLYIHEDIPDGATGAAKQAINQQDELYVATPSRKAGGRAEKLVKFADMGSSPTASPCANEWTGGVFGPDGTFWVNQQHADSVLWKVRLADMPKGQQEK
jgi:secreted PhoX family phosphatase